MSGGIERFLLSGTAAWESSTRTGAHEAGLGGIMKHDLVINGIVIEDLEASRDYTTAKELVLEEYLRLAAGHDNGTPSVFAQGNGRAVVVVWEQVATIEARLKNEDPRKAPDFDIMKTIGLDTLLQGEGIRASGLPSLLDLPRFLPVSDPHTAVKGEGLSGRARCDRAAGPKGCRSRRGTGAHGRSRRRCGTRR